MRNFIKIILILLAVIGVLFFVLTFYFEKNFKKTNSSFSKQDISLIESLFPREKNKATEIKYLDFFTADKKLKLTFLSDWTETKEEKILSNVFQKDLSEKYGLKVLFLAIKLNESGINQLIISEGLFDGEEKIENIINILEESMKNGGWEKENIGLDADNEGVFEAKYKKDNAVIHLKEKLILLDSKDGKRKAYFVTLSSLEKNWGGFEDEAKKIINSIQIVN